MGKKKPGARYACGKRKRPSQNTLASIERDSLAQTLSVVLAQPHRRGNTDQKCSSALGRLVLARKLRSEVYDAGNEYADIVLAWRAARGVPIVVRLNMGGDGLGPSDETVRDWRQRIDRIEAGVSLVASDKGLSLMNSICLDDQDPNFLDEIITCAALVELSYILGRLSKNSHPFVSGGDLTTAKSSDKQGSSMDYRNCA